MERVERAAGQTGLQPVEVAFSRWPYSLAPLLHISGISPGVSSEPGRAPARASEEQHDPPQPKRLPGSPRPRPGLCSARLGPRREIPPAGLRCAGAARGGSSASRPAPRALTSRSLVRAVAVAATDAAIGIGPSSVCSVPAYRAASCPASGPRAHQPPPRPPGRRPGRGRRARGRESAGDRPGLAGGRGGGRSRPAPAVHEACRPPAWTPR